MHLPMDFLSNNPEFLASSAGKSFQEIPLGFIDIGARGGVHPLTLPLAKHTAILAFEPDEAECQRMQAEVDQSATWASFTAVAKAIAGREGPATLHCFKSAVNNSLRPHNAVAAGRYRIHSIEPTGQFDIQATTLDQVLLSGDFHLPPSMGEFIKLDTQGTEYEILVGAKKILDERTVAIVAEVCFFHLYEGQKLFSEVETLLRQSGFSFYGFDGIHTRSRKVLNKKLEGGRERALWADAIFFKDPIPNGLPTAQLTTRQRHALFASAILTGYYDFALELAEGPDLPLLEKLVHQCAHIPPARAASEAQALINQIQNDPKDANIALGKFIDRHRSLPDYDDVR